MSEQIWGVNEFKRQNMQTDHMNTFIISSVLKIKVLLQEFILFQGV